MSTLMKSQEGFIRLITFQAVFNANCGCSLHLVSLQWRHYERDGVSNHQPHDCLLNRLFRRKWKKTSKLRVTGLCEGNSPVTGEFPAQMASNAENASIWWRHYVATRVALLALCDRCFPSQRFSNAEIVSMFLSKNSNLELFFADWQGIKARIFLVMRAIGSTRTEPSTKV